jgi:hypothetical protein
MTRSISAAFVVCVAAVGLPVVAGATTSLEAGSAALDQKNFPVALRLLRPLAEHGNAVAQYKFGVMYEHGWGVAKSFPQALIWYQMSAGQKYSYAEFNLGNMYATGEGVPQDYVIARIWLDRAADKGFAFAQSNLGLLYAYGLGVPRDNVEAYKWFTLAANGRPIQGIDVRQAALKNRQSIMPKMTLAQIAEGQHRVQDWTAKHSDRIDAR